MGEIPSGGMWKVRNMNKTLARMTALGATLALVLTTLIVFIPPAAAQQAASKIEVTIVPDDAMPNGRLLPETGTARTTVKVKVTIDAVQGCIATVQLTYKATNPNYATVIFNP